jgi:hypothetical protein
MRLALKKNLADPMQRKLYKLSSKDTEYLLFRSGTVLAREVSMYDERSN